MGFYDLLIALLVGLTIHMIHGSTCLVEAQNIDFSYPLGFSLSDNFLMVSDAQYYADNSSFLLNSRAASLLILSCGRLLYGDTVRMKDVTSGTTASFHTTFTFSITGPNTYKNEYGFVYGDGLAFTFANNDTLKNQDMGGSLCLLKEANSGQPSNQLFAVEFDTYQNPEHNDPSNNHIGVDINNVNSTWLYNLCGGTLINCMYLCNGGFFTTWIDYDNTTQKLDVYFANGSLSNNIPKPLKPLIKATLSLSSILLDEVIYVGFSASTGSASEVYQIQAW